MVADAVLIIYSLHFFQLLLRNITNELFSRDALFPGQPRLRDAQIAFAMSIPSSAADGKRIHADHSAGAQRRHHIPNSSAPYALAQRRGACECRRQIAADALSGAARQQPRLRADAAVRPLTHAAPPPPPPPLPRVRQQPLLKERCQTPPPCQMPRSSQFCIAVCRQRCQRLMRAFARRDYRRAA